MRFRSLAKCTQRAAGARSRMRVLVRARAALGCFDARLAQREGCSRATRFREVDSAPVRVKAHLTLHPRGRGRRARNITVSVQYRKQSNGTTRRPRIRRVLAKAVGGGVREPIARSRHGRAAASH